MKLKSSLRPRLYLIFKIPRKSNIRTIDGISKYLLLNTVVILVFFFSKTLYQIQCKIVVIKVIVRIYIVYVFIISDESGAFTVQMAYLISKRKANYWTFQKLSVSLPLPIEYPVSGVLHSTKLNIMSSLSQKKMFDVG